MPQEFSLSYDNYCTDPCLEVWWGFGLLPEGVARITYDMPDGTTQEATVTDGVWLLRYQTAGQTYAELPPIIVHAYAADGSVVIEGDTRILE